MTNWYIIDVMIMFVVIIGVPLLISSMLGLWALLVVPAYFLALVEYIRAHSEGVQA